MTRSWNDDDAFLPLNFRLACVLTRLRSVSSFIAVDNRRRQIKEIRRSIMSSPSLKDLPKVALDLKSELEGFNHGCMKKAATAEKNVLPSAEDVAAEKTQQTLIAGIETFDPSSLKHTTTQEKNPLPDKDAIQQEKGKQQLISGIENFDPAKLKHAETLEKNPLPTKEAIDAEKIAA
ncbi:hypothetical protein KPH14_006691 [Odynerus spinipes]|uniref:Thymosin beta n=1 Tax=Odynerus spinipes TaxID=1348599 RepID=A0AAD9RR97_9HYME|nr:hypothetical protein KPH14_006691 [Odynerus spinipes]